MSSKKETSIPQCLDDLIEVSALAQMLFAWEAKDTEENVIDTVKKWMTAPNDCLFDSSPLEVCMRGEGYDLIKSLKDKLGV